MNQRISEKGKVYFIGAGPGDPSLLTIKAKTMIDRSDLIIYTGSLISRKIFNEAKKARILDSAGMHLEQIVEAMVSAAKEGAIVARVHDGDPSVFGALLEQMIPLEENGVEYEVVPGVSSVFAAVAALNSELTIPEVSQTLILTRVGGRTMMPRGQELRELAIHNATIVCYLSAALIDKAVKELIKGGYSKETPAAVVQRASCPDEKIIRGSLANIADRTHEAKIEAQALIMVGEVFRENITRLGLKHRSKLYDKNFSHSFRKAISKY